MSDVIVVGGGSAGCLVASRLAAAGSTVVLVEAGDDLRGREPTSARDGFALWKEHGWGYRAEPDAAGNAPDVWRSRVLGGNAWVTRFAMRNHESDYARWDPIIGGGWSFSEVRDAFNTIERDLDHGDDEWHGADGPIPVTRYADIQPTPFLAAVVEAMVNRGIPQVPDLNRPGVTGCGPMPMNSIDGRRVISVDLLTGNQSGLEVMADTMVGSVLIEGRRAVGVRLADGSTLRAGTVVLASGVYGSPCLLMRSGIGPAELLEELRIPVLIGLPGVGHNLCDHAAVSLDLGYRGTQREGPLLHRFATISSPSVTADDGPDLGLWASDPEDDPAEGWLDVVLLRPEARGTVAPRSADPSDPPRIRLPSPTDGDVALLRVGVERALDLLTVPALDAICRDPAEVVPGHGRVAWIRDEAYSLPHTVGTCAMGRSPAAGSVVDGSGQVHGVSGLYVTDASILPGPPTGFPHLVALMMASRITDGLVSHAA